MPRQIVQPAARRGAAARPAKVWVKTRMQPSPSALSSKRRGSSPQVNSSKRGGSSRVMVPSDGMRSGSPSQPSAANRTFPPRVRSISKPPSGNHCLSSSCSVIARHTFSTGWAR